jgi:hypothetical protein
MKSEVDDGITTEASAGGKRKGRIIILFGSYRSSSLRLRDWVWKNRASKDKLGRIVVDEHFRTAVPLH